MHLKQDMEVSLNKRKIIQNKLKICKRDLSIQNFLYVLIANLQKRFYKKDDKNVASKQISRWQAISCIKRKSNFLLDYLTKEFLRGRYKCHVKPKRRKPPKKGSKSSYGQSSSSKIHDMELCKDKEALRGQSDQNLKEKATSSSSPKDLSREKLIQLWIYCLKNLQK